VELLGQTRRNLDPVPVNTHGQRWQRLPCFGDQPTLGITRQLYVTTNEFSIPTGVQRRPSVRLPKKVWWPALRSTSRTPPISPVAARSRRLVQPATSTGSPNAEFFLNSLDPNGTGRHRIGVWAMTDRTALQHGNLPKLSAR